MRVWVASLLFYSFVYILCELLRYLVVRFVPKQYATTAELLHEFIGGLRVCVPMFDVGTVLEVYGLTGLFIEITVLELANCFLQRDAIAHPCPLITGASRGKVAVRRAVQVFAVQMASAFVSFYVARLFWSFGVHPRHTELLNDEHCVADLTVALTTGALVEGGATFIGKAFEHFASQRYADSNYESLLNSAFSGFLCTLGIHLTGMYANPLVAWACTFNCEGVTHLGHLIVYWLSPLIGWYLAEICFEEKEEDEKKKEE